MRNLTRLIMMSGLLLFYSSMAIAHNGASSAGIPGLVLHPFTSIDHLLTLVLVIAGIAYLFYRQYSGSR